ncbi:hypothetical protein K469DRAFT_709601 [Zopfia rhizophila CBS 207.26]|uniref:Uncharacterized protein n=1 Tax=Zopfia rhizophila CBS 207.26 TaxID=1314779 RepID=A0A6A6EPI2_9PEZI|nr:hypothetical protein K469DRAFT_709601 [Zopfia rhizophila CBS 207.26]
MHSREVERLFRIYIVVIFLRYRTEILLLKLLPFTKEYLNIIKLCWCHMKRRTTRKSIPSLRAKIEVA